MSTTLSAPTSTPTTTTPTFQKSLHPSSSFLLASFKFFKPREKLNESYVMNHLRDNIRKFAGEYGSFEVSVVLFTLHPRPICILECQRRFLPLLRLCLMRDWNVTWTVERVCNCLWRALEEERRTRKMWDLPDDLDMGEDALDYEDKLVQQEIENDPKIKRDRERAKLAKEKKAKKKTTTKEGSGQKPTKNAQKDKMEEGE